MGPAVLVVLALCVVVVLGFVAYGTYLGLLQFARVMNVMWLYINHERDTLAWEPPADAEGRHCWDIHACPSQDRRACPSCTRADVPCWLTHIRLDREHRLSSDCLTCGLFSIPDFVANA